AADVRAATPSVAAELVVPARTDEQARLDTYAARLQTAAGRALSDRRQVLNNEKRALEANHPKAQLAAERERIGVLLDRAARVIGRRLEIERTTLTRNGEVLPAIVATQIGIARAELSRQSAALSALSPYATLERGYSIVRAPDGSVLRDAGKVGRGDEISVKLQRGELGARVESVRDSGR